MLDVTMSKSEVDFEFGDDLRFRLMLDVRISKSEVDFGLGDE
jgi:hypothetical protein